MTNFQAVYYRDRDGHEPVRAFIEALHEDEQAALDNQIDRLNVLSDKVPHLPFPHSSQVEGELRELREIDVARTRWDDFKTRMDANGRVPPRAAGRDAP